MYMGKFTFILQNVSFRSDNLKVKLIVDWNFFRVS